MKRWLLLLLIVAATLAYVAVPVFLIQPFRPQTESALAVGYALRSWAPLVTIAALLLCVFLVARMWRGSHWWTKALLPLLLIPVCAAVWFAGQNHFEWMFNPLAHALYASADEASFVAPDDMLMAVANNNEAVAYPIRQMAYHHLVADTVGGTPIVSTY